MRVVKIYKDTLIKLRALISLKHDVVKALSADLQQASLKIMQQAATIKELEKCITIMRKLDAENRNEEWWEHQDHTMTLQDGVVHVPYGGTIVEYHKYGEDLKEHEDG